MAAATARAVKSIILIYGNGVKCISMLYVHLLPGNEYNSHQRKLGADSFKGS